MYFVVLMLYKSHPPASACMLTCLPPCISLRSRARIDTYCVAPHAGRLTRATTSVSLFLEAVCVPRHPRRHPSVVTLGCRVKLCYCNKTMLLYVQSIDSRNAHFLGPAATTILLYTGACCAHRHAGNTKCVFTCLICTAIHLIVLSSSRRPRYRIIWFSWHSHVYGHNRTVDVRASARRQQNVVLITPNRIGVCVKSPVPRKCENIPSKLNPFRVKCGIANQNVVARATQKSKHASRKL